MLTHFAPAGNQEHLIFTAEFFPLAFGLFEAVLGCDFPYGALQQVYVSSESGLVRPVAAAGLQILPTTMLFSSTCFEQVFYTSDQKCCICPASCACKEFSVLEMWWQAVEARLAGAAELARQWFGVFMRSKAPADSWLMLGLAGWLEDQFVKQYMGRNELAYRFTLGTITTE